ncbi:MAG: tetratricopeptide repeat protein, partial [Planctomycetes bacterium]|nr:tetratricopeptide repeat protein [Planctomycetota bacterium]
LGLCNNIGATLQDLERNADAEPYLRRAATIAADVLGPDHEGTLTIQVNLAGLESDLGDTTRAAEMFSHVVERRTAVVGADALDTLIARYGYWNALWKGGRHADAAAGFGELSNDVVTALGAEHWLAAQCDVAWARALLDCDRAADALPLAERAERRLFALLGADHPRTRTALELVETIRKRSTPSPSAGSGQ